MANWKALIDFSGSSDPQSKFVTAGIVLATENTFEKLRPRWNDLLKQYGLDYYHVSDLNNPYGQFRKLSKENQEKCHIKLFQELRKVNLEYIIHVIRRSEIYFALQELPHRKLEAHNYLLELGIFDIKRRVESKRLGSTVNVIIEAGEKLSSEVFDVIRKECKQHRLGPVREIGVRKKFECVELQIADLVAYEGYKHAINKTVTPEIAERRSFTSLKLGNPLRFYLHSYITVKSWYDFTLSFLSESNYYSNR